MPEEAHTFGFCYQAGRVFLRSFPEGIEQHINIKPSKLYVSDFWIFTFQFMVSFFKKGGSLRLKNIIKNRCTILYREDQSYFEWFYYYLNFEGGVLCVRNLSTQFLLLCC